ncbi:MAG: ABC transporter substrate-binding protein [Thermodesulfobacteriaceae bacterium]|jgi:iron complex transport system substrate-binding protein
MVCRAIFKVLVLILFLSFIWVEVLQAETIRVTDKLGRTVTIDVPVKRAVIVTTYELIPALNLWNQVVGVSRWAEEVCGLYRAILNENPNFRRQTVGGGSDLNVEAVLKLNPDLVITWTYNPNTIWFLEKKGIKVIGIYPDSLQELYEVMRLYGKLFGKEKRVEEVIKEMEKIFDLIRVRVSKIPPEKRKRVIYIRGKPTTVSCGGITNDVIKLIGGINPACSIKETSSIKERNADVSIERIIQWNPDVIFIWGYARYDENWLYGNSQWKHVKAVREKRVYKLPRWSTWSPRLAPIALYMAMKLYPEQFQDVNFEEVADNFYKKVFGISYYKVKHYEGY